MLENNVNKIEPAKEIVFIVDRSGSMCGLESDTIGGFNAMLKEQQAQPGAAVITTVLFDKNVTLLHDRIDIHAVAPMTMEDYRVGGGTALLDAVGLTIKKLRKKQKPMAAEYRGKALFFIITDGEENSSKAYTRKKVMDMITHQKENHGWDFIFMGANVDEINEAGKIGISADKAISFIADAFGMSSTWSTASLLSTNFRKHY